MLKQEQLLGIEVLERPDVKFHICGGIVPEFMISA